MTGRLNMKIKSKLLFIISGLILFSVVSCSNFFVNSLSSKKIAELKSGEAPGELLIVRDEYTLNELTFRVEVADDKVIVADNSLKRLQVLDSDGKPQLIIGGKINQQIEGYKNFNFGVIGAITMDDGGNLYVQNRLDTGKNSASGETANFSPSYILVFDQNGDLQYTMGKLGTPEVPFFYIEKLWTDSEKRLHVISRSFNSWELYRFNNRKRDKFVDFSKFEFKEKEDNNTYNGIIENIIIFSSGNEVIISVAYYHDVRFKYRKLYIYSLEKEKFIREIGSFPDPKNVPFSISDDKIIYFWNIEGKDIKFMLTNLDGDVINNIRLKIEPNTIFSKIITDNEGNIYSYQVSGNTLQVFRWN